jgi:Family of unknown function (DUF5906)
MKDDARTVVDALPPSVSLDDFFAYMPSHSFIYIPTREMWPASSVNARVPPVVVGRDANGKPKTISASAWLAKHRAVVQMTWAPGADIVVNDHVVSDGGWIKKPGDRCFNLYRAPIVELGDATKAGGWVQHIRKVFGADADHIIDWLAHRVQRPHEKINHALVLGGAPGIGKDTLLEPVKRAVGHWNFAEVSPQHMLGRFNGFLRSVILRVSEARDLGEVNRFQFYDHMKSYTAAPPDVLRVDEKNLREHSILNCCGVIITTNYKTNGIFLPADDRRHFVAWSELTANEFGRHYWLDLWHWYGSGGDAHVAAFLKARDISQFNAKAPPTKTAAFWEIVDANRSPEDAELADALDDIGNPDATTLDRVKVRSRAEFVVWANDRKNRRAIPHRFEQCGYVPVRNDAAADGLWKISGRRQVVYARSSLSISERLKAAKHLVSVM